MVGKAAFCSPKQGVTYMKQRFQQFMAGRYGVDQLSRVFLAVSLVFMIVSIITGFDWFYLVAVIILGYTYFRMFSRNISKRYAENQKFLNWKYRLVVKKDQKKKQ